MNGKGPAKVLEDKRMQRDLKDAADSLRSAADALREPSRPKRRGRLLLLAIVGAGLALALSEDLRNKVPDAPFGAEEELESAASTPPAAADGAEAVKAS